MRNTMTLLRISLIRVSISFPIEIFAAFCFLLTGCGQINGQITNLSSLTNSVTPGYQLVFSTQPTTSVNAGSTLGTAPIIQVKDNSGTLITTGALSTAVITLQDPTGNGGLAGTISATAVGGIATFPNGSIKFEKAGTKTLKATTTVTGFGTLTANSATITVVAPSLSSIAAFSGPDDPNGSVDGNGTSARLAYANMETSDGTYIYVYQDWPFCVIRRYNISTTAVDTWAGVLYSCGSADGVLGTGKVPTVTGGFTNDGTYIYFNDYGKIRRISIATGTISTIAGTGAPGYSDNAIGTSAKFDFGNGGGLFINGTDMYIGDSGNCRIRKIDLSNSNFPVTTVAGTGTCGSVDNASALSAKIGYPSYFAMDATYLYFVDYYGSTTLKKMNWSTTAITTVYTSGDSVAGLAVIGTNIYLTKAAEIFKATIGTWTFSAVAGQSWVPGEVDGTSAVSYLGGGWLIASGSTLYLEDSANGAIRSLDTTTNTLTTLVGTPNEGQGLVTNTTGANSRYLELQDVVSDGTNLYVFDFDTNYITPVSMTDGSTVTSQGSGWGMAPNWAQTMTMVGGKIYLGDGCVIRVIDPSTWSHSVYAGSGICGDATGSLTTAQFNSIEAMVSDQSNLYVFDNNSIKKIDMTAQTVSILSGTPGSAGCTMGSSSSSLYQYTASMTYLNGKLYFSNYNCHASAVVQVDTTTGTSTFYAGNGTFGYVDGAISGAEFNIGDYSGNPITTDGIDLYIDDYDNGVIRKIDTTAGTISTIMGSSTQLWQIDGPLASAREGVQGGGPKFIYYGYGKLYVGHSRGLRVVQ